MLMLGFASVFPWGLPGPLSELSSPSGVELRKFISDEFPLWCKYSWSPLDISLWELLIFTTGQCVSLRKERRILFHIFTKSICFSTFYRETPQGSLPELLEGGQQVRTLRCQLPLRGSGHHSGCLLYWSAGKEEIGSILFKNSTSLRLEHQKWLFSIVTTGRWHNVYKPSLGHGAEPSSKYC